jgi:hypothetical protein
VCTWNNRVNGNNDGFHFISAEYVTVSGCTVKSQDDGCAMFGSCKFITIANSSFSTRWSVFRFGGGSAENITISKCLLYQVYGCPIKFQVNAGSCHQNISFSNLLLEDVTGPIHLSVGPRPHGENDALRTAESNATQGILRNISFSNIQGTVTTIPVSSPKTPSPTPSPRGRAFLYRAQLRRRSGHGEHFARQHSSHLVAAEARRKTRPGVTCPRSQGSISCSIPCRFTDPTPAMCEV